MTEEDDRPTLKFYWRIIQEELEKLLFSQDMSSVELREVNNYLIRKSPLGHYFRSFGLTSGQELGRVFAYNPTRRFFSAIRTLYSLFLLAREDAELDYIPVVTSPHALWSLTEDGWKLILRRYHRCWRDAKTGVERYTQILLGYGDVYDATVTEGNLVMKRVTSLSTDTLLTNLSFADKNEVVAYYLTIRNRELWGYEPVQRFLAVREEDIREITRKNHFWREKAGEYFRVEDAEAIARRLKNILSAYNEFRTCDDGYTEENLRIREMNIRFNGKKKEKGLKVRIELEKLPEMAQPIVERLIYLHGEPNYTVEANGRHLYFPDPELLKLSDRELMSKHLAVNIDKYFGLGKWNVKENPTPENKMLWEKYRRWGKEVPCCMSMKTGRKMSITALLSMPPLSKRVQFTTPHFLRSSSSASQDSSPEEVLPPGEVVPLTSLPKEHPACIYLRQRGFDPQKLGEVYSVSYCVEENPDGAFYGSMPLGLRNSPLGRIIFPIIGIDGEELGWQARAIVLKDRDGDDWLWSGKEWVEMTKYGEVMHSSPRFTSGLAGALKKYVNAKGMRRNSSFFGIRQAWEMMKDRPLSQREVVLMEGALDVAKGGPPCVALLGKSMSESQAEVIANHFGKVSLVCDNDAAGTQFLFKVKKMLASMPIRVAKLPPGKKDLGECSYEEAKFCLRDDAKSELK